MLIPSRGVSVTFEIRDGRSGPVGRLHIGDTPLLVNYSQIDVKPGANVCEIVRYERAGFDVAEFPCFGIASDIGSQRVFELVPRVQATGLARLHARLDRSTHSEWVLEAGLSVHGSLGGHSISVRRKCELVIDVDAKIGWYFEEEENDPS